MKLKTVLGIRFSAKTERRLAEAALLGFRVIIALLMLSHGYGKLTGFFDIAPRFMNFLGLGGHVSLALVVMSEFFGSLCVMAGLFTRWASFSIVFTMLVAAFIAHGADPFAKKELAVLYAAAFLVFAVAGGGKYSLDSLIRRKL